MKDKDKEKIKCDECSKFFSSRKQIEQHKRDFHHDRIDKPPRKPFLLSKAARAIIVVAVIGVAAAIVIVVGQMYQIAAPKRSLSSTVPLPVDNIQCNTME